MSASLRGGRMKRQVLIGFILLCLWANAARAEGLEDVTLRYHTQWEVGDLERQILSEKYGESRVAFDHDGKAAPQSLSPELMDRWKNFYELCMRDGCYFCDFDIGSCETGTCGPDNSYCRPYMGSEGLPKCGVECADYAFMATL
jgi:hypothetical protein